MTARAAADSCTPCYPNGLTRLLLQALEETLGPASLADVLRAAGLAEWLRHRPPLNAEQQVPFGQISTLLQALETLYGASGLGLAQRAGCACFRRGLDEFGAQTALASLDFRLLPLGRKLRATVEVLAGLLNQHGDQQVRLEEEDGRLIWQDSRCPLCWGRRAAAPCDHLTVGFLQESLYWASGGRHFAVTQTRCAAAGDDVCSFVIEKKALD